MNNKNIGQNLVQIQILKFGTFFSKIKQNHDKSTDIFNIPVIARN
jgi:hypothetical protein